jgi:hypothetical protein
MEPLVFMRVGAIFKMYIQVYEKALSGTIQFGVAADLRAAESDVGGRISAARRSAATFECLRFHCE